MTLVMLRWLQWFLCWNHTQNNLISEVPVGFLAGRLWAWKMLILYIRVIKHVNSGLDKHFKKVISVVFKFIITNTNNYELQKMTTMCNNTLRTHMLEIITKQKNEMMDITSQYVVCFETFNLFYKPNSFYWISYNHSGTKHVHNNHLYHDDDDCVARKEEWIKEKQS